MTSTHTIFGAGQVGLPLARMLAAAGHEVRLARRGPAGPDIENVTWLRGDASDEAFVDEACRGASTVYHCMNPSNYHGWEQTLPPLAHAMLGAARRSGAHLVVLDNLYMYGRSDGPMREDTPMQPCSVKGALRARLATEMLEARKRGEVSLSIGRASDYFGPGATQAAVFHDRFFERLPKGKPVEVFGDPDQPHSYSYTPDVARGLMVLGTHAAAKTRPVWHLPVSAQLTTRELVSRFGDALGVEGRVRPIPTWALQAVGVFVPMAREIAEMVYQWKAPFRVDDSTFRSVFGVGPTPLEEAIQETLASHGSTRTAAA